MLVHAFVCRVTIEERIDAMLADKRKLADEVLSGGAEQALTELDADELLELRLAPVGDASPVAERGQPARPADASADLLLRIHQVHRREAAPAQHVGDGLTTELRFVARRGDAGQVFLDRVLEHDYRPWQAEVSDHPFVVATVGRLLRR